MAQWIRCSRASSSARSEGIPSRRTLQSGNFLVISSEEVGPVDDMLDGVSRYAMGGRHTIDRQDICWILDGSEDLLDSLEFASEGVVPRRIGRRRGGVL